MAEMAREASAAPAAAAAAAAAAEAAEEEWEDVTALFRAASAEMGVGEYVPEAYDLHEGMNAVQLMDIRMDPSMELKDECVARMVAEGRMPFCCTSSSDSSSSDSSSSASSSRAVPLGWSHVWEIMRGFMCLESAWQDGGGPAETIMHCLYAHEPALESLHPKGLQRVKRQRERQRERLRKEKQDQERAKGGDVEETKASAPTEIQEKEAESAEADGDEQPLGPDNAVATKAGRVLYALLQGSICTCSCLAELALNGDVFEEDDFVSLANASVPVTTLADLDACMTLLDNALALARAELPATATAATTAAATAAETAEGEALDLIRCIRLLEFRKCFLRLAGLLARRKLTRDMLRPVSCCLRACFALVAELEAVWPQEWSMAAPPVPEVDAEAIPEGSSKHHLPRRMRDKWRENAWLAGAAGFSELHGLASTTSPPRFARFPQVAEIPGLLRGRLQDVYTITTRCVAPCLGFSADAGFPRDIATLSDDERSYALAPCGLAASEDALLVATTALPETPTPSNTATTTATNNKKPGTKHGNSKRRKKQSSRSRGGGGGGGGNSSNNNTNSSAGGDAKGAGDATTPAAVDSRLTLHALLRHLCAWSRAPKHMYARSFAALLLRQNSPFVLDGVFLAMLQAGMVRDGVVYDILQHSATHAFLVRGVLPNMLESLRALLMGRSKQLWRYEDLLSKWNTAQELAARIDRDYSVAMELPANNPATQMVLLSAWLNRIVSLLQHRFIMQELELDLVPTYELDMHYWYWDHLYRNRINLLRTVRRTHARLKARNDVIVRHHEKAEKNAARSKKGNKKRGGGGTSQHKLARQQREEQEAEDAADAASKPSCEELWLEAQQSATAGLVMLFLGMNKADLLDKPSLNDTHTDWGWRFSYRFRGFARVFFPPPLHYEDYVREMAHSARFPVGQMLTTAESLFDAAMQCLTALNERENELGTNEDPERLEQEPAQSIWVPLENEAREFTRAIIGNRVACTRLRERLSDKEVTSADADADTSANDTTSTAAGPVTAKPTVQFQKCLSVCRVTV